MKRYVAMAAVGFFLAASAFSQAGGGKVKTFEFKGKFTKDDGKDQQRGGAAQVHVVKLKKGKTYTILMASNQVDSYLRLQTPKGVQIAEDDDSGGGLNSLIQFSCTADGDYKIVCTTFAANTYGDYSLTVKLAGASNAPGTAHVRMIGKDAPDFKGDFAVNGKPVLLSDLEGKVVLLYFWEVRSSASAALLPRLNEWHKAHKGKGLAIVGATFYAADIGQPLAFDKETGAVKKVASADRKSDQALLNAFAAHHKVEHLLMALPKSDALAAFNAYAVNGLPQVVLLDRKGVIRFIDVAGAKNLDAVEKEMRKLLADK